MIRLSSRPSNRVPFGTGASVLKLIHSLQQKENFYLYSPQCFAALKRINCALPELKKPEQLKKWDDFALLQKIGLESAFRKILEQAPEHQREKQLQDCFDGFKTMRFIHELTESKYPKIPWREALDRFNQLAA